jgi:hypothetical protein
MCHRFESCTPHQGKSIVAAERAVKHKVASQRRDAVDIASGRLRRVTESIRVTPASHKQGASMSRRSSTVLFVIYIIIGVVVAAGRDYFEISTR